jgi:hypothetical protein
MQWCNVLAAFVSSMKQLSVCRVMKSREDRMRLAHAISVPWGTYLLDPLEKYYVCCDLSVREKAWRGKPSLERMLNTLSHWVKTLVPGGMCTH